MNVDMTNLYRSRGMIPNRYWYQLNGQSAQANWLEQREAIYSRIQEQEEEVVPQIKITVVAILYYLSSHWERAIIMLHQ